jgi:hypothetical protein
VEVPRAKAFVERILAIQTCEPRSCFRFHGRLQEKLLTWQVGTSLSRHHSDSALGVRLARNDMKVGDLWLQQGATIGHSESFSAEEGNSDSLRC